MEEEEDKGQGESMLPPINANRSRAVVEFDDILDVVEKGAEEKS